MQSAGFSNFAAMAGDATFNPFYSPMPHPHQWATGGGAGGQMMGGTGGNGMFVGGPHMQSSKEAAAAAAAGLSSPLQSLGGFGMGSATTAASCFMGSAAAAAAAAGYYPHQYGSPYPSGPCAAAGGAPSSYDVIGGGVGVGSGGMMTSSTMDVTSCGVGVGGGGGLGDVSGSSSWKGSSIAILRQKALEHQSFLTTVR